MANRYQATTVHSLIWLAAANAVGVMLAVLLLVPEWGAILAPFTYGRWIPLHLNASLYGWGALPLVGLLFKVYLDDDEFDLPARIALCTWSALLLFACGTWLCGITSGKLFMEWAGPARRLFPAGLVFLWGVLAAGFRRQLDKRSGGVSKIVAKSALLILLAAIPPLLYWAADPALFPPINPASGGATGGSLLGSTLAVIAIIMAAPLMIGSRPARTHVAAATFIVLLAHSIGFSMLDHGNHSHHERAQLFGLFSLIIWWPLLVIYLREFAWPAGTRRWLFALCFWGAALLATALFTFLPGVLEAWKFTNALVGHSHLAMAGMLTSFNMIVLTSLSGIKALDRPRPFWLWQAGCLVHVAALLVLGTVEADRPSALFLGERAANILYGIRLVGGIAMLMASMEWLFASWRRGA